MVQLNRIIEAVRSTVPRDMWGEIARKLEAEGEPAEPLQEDEADIFDPAEDPFDAGELGEL